MVIDEEAFENQLNEIVKVLGIKLSDEQKAMYKNVVKAAEEVNKNLPPFDIDKYVEMTIKSWEFYKRSWDVTFKTMKLFNEVFAMDKDQLRTRVFKLTNENLILKHCLKWKKEDESL